MYNQTGYRDGPGCTDSPHDAHHRSSEHMAGRRAGDVSRDDGAYTVGGTSITSTHQISVVWPNGTTYPDPNYAGSGWIHRCSGHYHQCNCGCSGECVCTCRCRVPYVVPYTPPYICEPWVPPWVPGRVIWPDIMRVTISGDENDEGAECMHPAEDRVEGAAFVYCRVCGAAVDEG